MSDLLKELEYYSLFHNCFTYGEIIGIQEENCYLIRNLKDGTEEICDVTNIRKITNISQSALEKGKWEFIKGDDEFLDVNIKEQKGLFFILEFMDEEGNTSTKIARKKDLRCINYISFEELIEEKYDNIFLEIPPELSSWMDSEKFKENLEQIKEQIKDCENSEFFFTSYQDDENETLSLRVFCNIEKKDFIKLYLEAAIEGEKKLISVNKDKENSKKELEDVKKKNKTFFIPQKLVGLIIGKDGINIKNLKNKYGVNITIDSKKVNENPLSKVVIKGDNGENVEECSKEIDVVQKIFDISENCASEIKKRANKLMEDYRIKRIHVYDEEQKDDNNNIYNQSKVECIGNEEYINDFYNNEIKDFDKYSYGKNYDKYSSGSYYRKNKKSYNYYDYGYKNNYHQPYKNYNSSNNYY